jgi:hypothetical protein
MGRSDDLGIGAACGEGARSVPDVFEVPEYRLTLEDAYIAFLFEASLMGGPIRMLIRAALFILAAAMLIDLVFVSRDLRSLAMSTLATAAFLIVYSMPRGRARSAAAAAEGSGKLRMMAVRGLDNGRIVLNGGVTVPMTGRSNATAVDTGKHFIFVLFLAEGSRLLILPQRALRPDDVQTVRSMLARQDYNQRLKFFP